MGKMAFGACIASLALAFSSLSGCVVEAVPASPPSGIAVSGPPPQPVNEMRPPPPDARMIWVAGYWHWTGMQYTWIPGHWESAPPGSSWRVPRYSVREGSYFYEPGGWLRAP